MDGGVIWGDCISGMKKLPGKSFDLVFTDPPYGVDLEGNSQVRNGDGVQVKISYDDSPEDMEKFARDWLTEACRVGRKVLFTPGNPNIALYCNIAEPVDILFHYKSNGYGRTSLCTFNKCETFFLYGDWSGVHFVSNAFDIPLKNGFLREEDFLHPCPKSIALWTQILAEINPSNVLDPFLGSGTTAEACISLGIPWTGFELKRLYEPDITRRIERGKEKYRDFEQKKKRVSQHCSQKIKQKSLW